MEKETHGQDYRGEKSEPFVAGHGEQQVPQEAEEIEGQREVAEELA